MNKLVYNKKTTTRSQNTKSSLVYNKKVPVVHSQEFFGFDHKAKVSAAAKARKEMHAAKKAMDQHKDSVSTKDYLKKVQAHNIAQQQLKNSQQWRQFGRNVKSITKNGFDKAKSWLQDKANHYAGKPSQPTPAPAQHTPVNNAGHVPPAAQPEEHTPVNNVNHQPAHTQSNSMLDAVNQHRAEKAARTAPTAVGGHVPTAQHEEPSHNQPQQTMGQKLGNMFDYGVNKGKQVAGYVANKYNDVKNQIKHGVMTHVHNG